MQERDYVETKNNRLNIFTFNKRKKYKLTKKQAGTIIISGILALIIAVSASAVTKKVEIEKRNDQIIERFYEEDELANRVHLYLGISEQLNKLDLDKYMFDDKMLSQYQITNELKSPEELQKMINDFNLAPYSFSKFDLLQNSEKTKLILNLIIQERLINYYIYNTGYEVAHSRITSATKEMTGEAYGLNADNIKFRYNNTAGEKMIKLDVVDPKTGYKTTYDLKNPLGFGVNKKIFNGVEGMISVDSDSDKDNSDNYSYNEERNRRIEDTLEQSAIYKYEVDTEDLYDENLNAKFRKNAK